MMWMTVLLHFLDDLKVLRNGTLQNITLHSEVSYCK